MKLLLQIFPGAPAMACLDVYKRQAEKLSLLEAIKLLLANKYYIIIALIYVFIYMQTGITGVGIYYMTYILGNPALLGTFSMASMFPMIIGLAFTPALRCV